MTLQSKIGGAGAASVGLSFLAVAACFALAGPLAVGLPVILLIAAGAAAGYAYMQARAATTRALALTQAVIEVSRQSTFTQTVERVTERDELDRLNNALSDWIRGTHEPLEALSVAAQRIADGDLTVDLSLPQSTGAVHALVDRFQALRASLADLVDNVQTSWPRVAGSAEQLSAAIEQMSSSIEEVAATIQEVTRGAQNQSEQVAHASHALAQTAEQLRGIAAETKRVSERMDATSASAVKGRTSAAQASQRMNEVTSSVDQSAQVVRALAESIRRIDDFVNIIVRISDQTNLLSLNAAIEAARAGEHGRGFAVVAEEVRKLAEESARSAEEVQRAIAHINVERERVVSTMENATREVYEGSQVVGDAIASFEQVTQNVTDATRLVGGVARAVDEIALRGETVTRNVESVSSTAEETAASAEEVSAAIEEQTASMQELASTSQELARTATASQESIGLFRTDESRRAHAPLPAAPSSPAREPTDLPPMFRPPRAQPERARTQGERKAAHAAGKRDHFPLTREAERRAGEGGDHRHEVHRR